MTYPEFTEKDLPPFHEYFRRFPGDTTALGRMANAYAFAAVDAYRKRLMEQEPKILATVNGRGGWDWLPGALKLTSPGDVLYAAPMPQANESEPSVLDVVKACVDVARRQADMYANKYARAAVLDVAEAIGNIVKADAARAVLADEPLPQPDGPTQEQEAILQKLTDEAQAMGLYDAQPVQASGQAPSRPSDDALWDQTLKERDEYHDMADQLAEQIAAITGQGIGEHSSANDPWRNAMLAADDFIAAQIRALFAAPAADGDANG